MISRPNVKEENRVLGGQIKNPLKKKKKESTQTWIQKEG